MSPVVGSNRTGALSVPRGTSAVDRRPKLATYLAGSIITVVVAGFGVALLASLLPLSVSPIGAGYAILAVALLLAIQLLYFSRPSVRLDTRVSRVLLVVLALLGYVPVFTFDAMWTAMPAFFGGAVLLVLPARFAWPLFGLNLAAVLWIELRYDAPLLSIWTVLGVAVYSLVFAQLALLARMIRELHLARTELARRAVAEQRLAFARDLHDLLGLSLSAIALKGELVHRLMRKSREQAQAELAEITATAQRTLSDVRAVSHGYRELSLEKEFRTAQSLLTASDIAVRIHLDQGDLPVQARTLLAKVLQEGVTDVLRHSDVEHCEIAVHQRHGRVSLEIVNDGVGPDDLPAESELLARLPDEVATLGGTVRSGIGEDGRFRLLVELPLPDRVEPPPADDGSQLAHAESRRVRVLMPVTFTLFGLGAFVHELLLTTDGWHIALVAGSLVALLTLQFAYFNRPSTRLRSGQSVAMLFVQACLIYLPMLPLQGDWVSMPSLLMGCALLVLPPVAGWLVFAANAGFYLWLQYVAGKAGEDTLYAVLFSIGTVLAGLIVFGMLWLVRLVAELNHSRRRLAETAVAEERLRFARDLHDLLGMSLSAIALKSELTARVLPLDRDRATEELVEILGLTRQALSDVRSVASGYRELSLDSESRSARSVLASADVRVRMEMLQDELPAPVRTVLAVVLREGVTNVLRHSRVKTCEIALHRIDGGVSLEIVNDGVERPGARPATPAAPAADGSARSGTASGSGIGNLSHRVADLGGELTAGVVDDGRFRLRAVVPV
ncbi:histidine kinase [Amycolatopsis balhimycina DSM 5908]|uniref:Histidine kinase n=1 Tax=Amycolatopsis balhimycina DSM 5908 TaxID=1081091 RepID=A0A428W707_AMYBA|nr:histidine kinase [Amycolatopsis balhimycina]RSM38813.1 histidine kinase [Amycolatopsis balhimycina DSM 5908]